jgi:predicted RNA-binding Zn ribbon-like protein
MERFGPTRRGGPVFRWLGEALAIDLANTVMVVREGEAVELLPSEVELRSWLDRERPHLGGCEFAISHLSELREAREDVRDLLTATAVGQPLPPAAVDRLNAVAVSAPVSPQLLIADDGAPHLIDEPFEPHDIDQLLARVARSALRLVAGSDETPVNVCNAPSCGMFFVGRRRWCCAACGNRARAAKHYRRRSEAIG